VGADKPAFERGDFVSLRFGAVSDGISQEINQRAGEQGGARSDLMRQSRVDRHRLPGTIPRRFVKPGVVFDVADKTPRTAPDRVGGLFEDRRFDIQRDAILNTVGQFENGIDQTTLVSSGSEEGGPTCGEAKPLGTRCTDIVTVLRICRARGYTFAAMTRVLKVSASV
jgi:hypothetical protein